MLRFTIQGVPAVAFTAVAAKLSSAAILTLDWWRSRSCLRVGNSRQGLERNASQTDKRDREIDERTMSASQMRWRIFFGGHLRA